MQGNNYSQCSVAAAGQDTRRCEQDEQAGQQFIMSTHSLTLYPPRHTLSMLPSFLRCSQQQACFTAQAVFLTFFDG
jgi:hypothetical protein